MKKIIYTALFFATFLISSCGDESTDTEMTDSSPNTPENQAPIPTEEVEEEIDIEGEIVSGDFPSATGQLLFENETDDLEIVAGTPIVISFEASEMPEGVYAQIVSTDGTAISDGFFEITEIDTSEFSDTFFTFNVEVGDQISTGSFGIRYTVFNGDLVAEPEVVAITVNQRITPTQIIGRWSLVIDEDIEQVTITCINGTSFEIEDSTITSEDIFIIEFNNDGTYEEISQTTIRDLDFNASAEECTAIYSPEESFNDIERGTWSFNESTTELSIIVTEIDDLIDDTNDEIIPESERELTTAFAGIRNNGNTLTLTVIDEEGAFSSVFEKL